MADRVEVFEWNRFDGVRRGDVGLDQRRTGWNILTPAGRQVVNDDDVMP